MSKPIIIVSLGPGMSVPGGITRVIELIGTHLPANFRSVHIPTFTRFTGDPEVGSAERGNRLAQLLVYVLAILRAIGFSFLPRTIFHVHFAGRGSLLRKGLLCALLRLLRCRYVVHSHVAGTDLFPRWATGPLRGLMIWGLKGAKRVIVLTQFWSDFYVTLLGIPENRTLILPNPAEMPDTIPDRSKTKELNLLFLGRIGERKGAFDLIRAFARLDREIRSRTRLTLAGDGDVAFAQALVTELGIEDRIHLTGWIGTEEVRSYLKNSDVLLLPSRAEGMAMALIEAMSWGLAVIATNVGGASEFLEDRRNCLLVQPGNIHSITSAIATLTASPDLRLELGSAARETIGRFAIPGYIAALRALYEEIAEPVTPSSEPVDDSEELRPAKSSPQHPLDSVQI